MSSLPPISNSALPADVQKGTQADKDRYKAALAFENQLISQLTQQLADTSATADSGDDSGDGTSSAATSTYKSMLPGVLADSITQAGGLGLARTIAQNLKEAGR